MTAPKMTDEVVSGDYVYKAEFHGCGMWALLARTKRARKFKFVCWVPYKGDEAPSPEFVQKGIEKHLYLLTPFVPEFGKLYRVA